MSYYKHNFQTEEYLNTEIRKHHRRMFTQARFEQLDTIVKYVLTKFLTANVLVFVELQRQRIQYIYYLNVNCIRRREISILQCTLEEWPIGILIIKTTYFMCGQNLTYNMTLYLDKTYN